MLTTMSILGLYNYDSDIFADLTVPAGLEKSVVINGVLAQSSNMPVMYPDPRFFRMQMRDFSLRKIVIWERLYKTTLFEYNPIENYDRQEDISATETNNVSGNAVTDSTNSGQSASTGKNTVSNTTSDTTDYKKAAFDSDTLKGVEQNSTTGSNGSVSDTTESTNASNTGKVTSVTQNTEQKNSAVTNRTHGNIGVTTTQQMIQQERDITTFDIYQVIIDDIIDSFCLSIYV